MLIGLTGRAGAGKDSAAAILHAAGWHTFAHADALRIEVAAAWSIDPRVLTDRATKEAPQRALCAGHGMQAEWLHWCAMQGISLYEPRSPRWLMQRWGTWRRRSSEDYWVRHVATWVAVERSRGHADLVVTDVRYANEAASLRRLGGHILRVHRPDADAAAPMAADTSAHSSEVEAAHIVTDDVIHNDGPLAALPAEVWRVVQGLAPVSSTPAVRVFFHPAA